MKNKILIGAGILLTVFVLFLIFLCGGSGADKIVTEEELKVTIQNVTCQVNEEENDYETNNGTNQIFLRLFSRTGFICLCKFHSKNDTVDSSDRTNKADSWPKNCV